MKDIGFIWKYCWQSMLKALGIRFSKYIAIYW